MHLGALFVRLLFASLLGPLVALFLTLFMLSLVTECDDVESDAED
jgi:hypothetical protein